MYHTVRPSVRVGIAAARDLPVGSYSSALRMNVSTPYYRSVKVQVVHMRRNGQGFSQSGGFHSSPFPRIPNSLRLMRAGEQQQQPLLKSTIEKETLASRSAEMAKAKAAKEASEAASGIAGEGAVVQPKKSMWERVKAELVHYWHGTKLLGKEIKISTKLAGRLLHGNKLTRREQRQLRRTTGDLMRLVPFSVFLIVPFMELLLPVALKLFPNMLPSTFEDKFAEEEKKRKLLKMRLEMAKFLQETIEESGIPGSSRAEAVKEFGDFFRKVRTTGEQASTDELIRVAKLFHDELTLDNLSRPQLVSMARYMNLNAFGTDNFLRYQIRNKMNSIKQDDKLIMAEGVDSLTTRELQAACQSRGIRTGGVSPARLRSELAQWLELNLTHAIPSSLLILSRAFSFSDSKDLATPVEALQATLSSLPDSLLTETELHVSELEGAATAQQKLEVLEQQEELIADELAQEEKEEKARKARKEEARLKKEAEEKEKEKQKAQEQEAAATTTAPKVPTTPTEVPIFDKSIPAAAAAGAPATLAGASELLTDAQVAAQAEKHAGATAGTEELTQAAEAATPAAAISEEEEDKAKMTEEQLLELREALCIMSSRSAVLEEREELEDLKEDRMEYKEDIEELAQVQRKEHNVSRRLGSRLEKMIAKLDQELTAYDADVGNKLQAFQANERGELSVADIEAALRVIKHAPDADNIKQIVKKLDVDGDGLVLLSHIVELADLVEDEEGTGVLVEGKKVTNLSDKDSEKEKKLKKEDVVKDD
ncbi:LETM1 and EF-hand domain-containing protein 1, mitochondrial [Entomortierella parvispora]|uniref:LETM1 and EF-hand domain-containing protein 1, mitochondrial n=1 Tax=Entomortierella parvispora TaxID=205924 RepID=A0A9P3HDN9_9FUNG|nr:LETM1 and EF-hand domain-containing protein 1, mitochondrial [Entomortierella parvispora]